MPALGTREYSCSDGAYFVDQLYTDVRRRTAIAARSCAWPQRCREALRLVPQPRARSYAPSSAKNGGSRNPA
jgi:hypothetical protein